MNQKWLYLVHNIYRNMKSISIHKIEEQLMNKIHQRATEKGLSLNKTIKFLLREALGLEQPSLVERRQSFEQFCGLWSEKDHEEFEQRTLEFSRIDQEDWT